MAKLRMPEGADPKQLQMRVDPDNILPVRCIGCGKDTFFAAYKLDRLPAVVSPSGKDMMFEKRVLVCLGCGHVFGTDLPKGKVDDKAGDEAGRVGTPGSVRPDGDSQDNG